MKVQRTCALSCFYGAKAKQMGVITPVHCRLTLNVSLCPISAKWTKTMQVKFLFQGHDTQVIQHEVTTAGLEPATFKLLA